MFLSADNIMFLSVNNTLFLSADNTVFLSADNAILLSTDITMFLSADKTIFLSVDNIIFLSANDMGGWMVHASAESSLLADKAHILSAGVGILSAVNMMLLLDVLCRLDFLAKI